MNSPLTHDSLVILFHARLYNGQILTAGTPDAISQQAKSCLVELTAEPQREALKQSSDYGRDSADDAYITTFRCLNTTGSNAPCHVLGYDCFALVLLQ